jgi:integrase
MKKPRPHGLRKYDKIRKSATFEFIVPGTQGRKRIQKTFAVAGWEEVVSKAAEFRKRIQEQHGLLRRAALPTFAEYVEAEWKKSFMPRWSKGKAVTYSSLLNIHLVPAFGDSRLDQIDDAKVEDFVLAMRQKTYGPEQEKRKYSPGYINSALVLLRTVLRHAQRRAVIPHYPLRERLPLLTEPKLRNELADEEEQRFLRAFDDLTAFRLYLAQNQRRAKTVVSIHFREARTFGGGLRADSEAAKYYFERFKHSKPFFLTALYTGLRRDDLRRLKWSSVDLANGVIRVVMEKTKEVAVVPISNRLRQALLRLRRSPVVSEYVFLTPDRKLYSVATINRYFVVAKSISGLTRRVRFHDLRHTFGSRLASAGVSTAIIRRCLGHTSTRMAERYSFPSDEAVKTVVTALDTPSRKHHVVKP